jgi:hypothetical protein
MLFHIDHNIQITGGTVMKSGFPLSLNPESGAVVHARWNSDLQHFFSAYASFSLTGFTRLAYYAARSIALTASSADRKESLLVPHLARAMTGGAADGTLPFGRSASVARAAGILTRDLDLGLEAEGCFPKRNLQIVAEIGPSFRAATPASAENVAESEKLSQDVAEITESRGIETAESALQSAVAIPVIARPFLGIAQNGVGLRGFLEFFLGALVIGILVGMISKGQLPVSALDLLIRSVLGDPKDFIIITFIIQLKSPLSMNVS